MRHIPVLMYHRICRPGEGGQSEFVVNVDVFERQLRYYAGRGYHTPPLEEILSNNVDKREMPGKPVVLTFDDGYVDNLENAAPLLKKYGFRAYVFLIGDFSIRTNLWDIPKGVVKANLVDHKQVLDLRGQGFVIGSHGLSHSSLPGLDENELARQFEISKKNIEAITGEPVKFFAYPYGDVDDRVKAAAGKAGYACAFATNSGPLSFDGDFFQIRRTLIANRADPAYLYFKLSGLEKAVRSCWSGAKAVIGRRPRYN